MRHRLLHRVSETRRRRELIERELWQEVVGGLKIREIEFRFDDGRDGRGRRMQVGMIAVVIVLSRKSDLESR